MNKTVILILFLICLGALCAHAQQAGSVNREKVNVTQQTEKDTVATDTTRNKQNLGQQIEKQAGELKNKIVDRGKEVTTIIKSQVNKITNLATAQKDTAVSDTTGHRKHGVAQGLKEKATDVKEKIVSSGKEAGSSTIGQIKKITDVKPPVARDISGQKGGAKVKELASQSIDTTGVGQVRQIGNDLRNEKSTIKQTVSGTVSKIRQEIPDSTDMPKISKQRIAGGLEEKALKLQYSSDDPENAPWKKNPFSKDDLGDLALPTDPSGKLPGTDNKTQDYKDKVSAIKSPTASGGAVSAVGTSVKNSLKKNQLTNFLDSVTSVAAKLDGDNLKQQLLGAKKIYSDKYVKKLYDSLGIDKADELLKAASGMLKTETPKDELLDRLNSSITGKDLKGVGYDAEKQSLNVKDAEKLNSVEKDFAATDLSALKSGDLSRLKLPQSVLSELPPLSASQLDSKYLPLIDSMRDVALKAKNYKLEEKQIKEDVKSTILKKKPTWLDKSYFEGIIGFFTDSTVNIIQLSPSLGYHFTDFLSVGLGPNLQVQLEQHKKLNIQAGFRSFLKAEIWKQRFYLQVEDNVTPSKIDKEFLSNNRITHKVLAGGGVLLPISKSLALNFAILHQINKDLNNPHRSPWVFRVGLSSVKKKHER